VFQTPNTVGVVIDTMRQLEAQLMMCNYQGFSATALDRRGRRPLY